MEILQYGGNQRRKENLFSRHLLPLVKGQWHGKRECEHCNAEIHPYGLCEKAGLASGKNVCGNVNRLFDTKGMNRILEKPLKTRDSGTLGVAGISCLVLGLC